VGLTPAPQGVGDFVYLAKGVIEMTDTDDETGTTGALLWHAGNSITFEEENNV